jgi:S1-C subfamily serine protease
MSPLTRTRPRTGVAVALVVTVIAALAVVLVTAGDRGTSAAGLPQASSASDLQGRFVDVIRRVSPQVVQIRTQVGLGSGIVFDDQGNIVTNAHVAGNSKRFAVTLADGGHDSATLVGTDPSNDIAVVHLDGSQPEPAAFADSSIVESGGIVMAIGNPLGLQSSVTQGIVSSLNRSVSEGNGVRLDDVIQTSAEINPGNSGGALVDLSGRVVGIPTLAALDPEFGNSPAPGIGFAIASNTVQRVASGLISAAGSN